MIHTIAMRLDRARNEMLLDAERHGCNRCWSDDLKSPCTCSLERTVKKIAINEAFNKFTAAMAEPIVSKGEN